MPEQLHAQPTSRPTGEHCDVVQRGADLCRRDPALFAAMVRRADYLVAQGMLAMVAAQDLALREAGA